MVGAVVGAAVPVLLGAAGREGGDRMVDGLASRQAAFRGVNASRGVQGCRCCWKVVVCEAAAAAACCAAAAAAAQTAVSEGGARRFRAAVRALGCITSAKSVVRGLFARWDEQAPGRTGAAQNAPRVPPPSDQAPDNAEAGSGAARRSARSAGQGGGGVGAAAAANTPDAAQQQEAEDEEGLHGVGQGLVASVNGGNGWESRRGLG